MPSTVTSVDVPNLLLGLAWLGELDRLQIQRLWFAGKSVSTVEKTLARLHKEGFIARRSGSVRDEQRGVTVPRLARWSLTPAGHKEVKTSDQYPAQPAVPRKPHLLAHDARTTEVIVRLIELGLRSELSSIFVAYELSLSPTQRRPVCDALVVMQFGSFDHPNLVPWSSGPAATGEDRMRFAIEADNNTEPLSVLASKADTYRKLFGSHAWARWWAEQHGPLPVPLWVAPTWTRARAIQREWKRAWHAGEWLVTSDEGLAQNELLSWRDGQECTMSLSFGTLARRCLRRLSRLQHSRGSRRWLPRARHLWPLPYLIRPYPPWLRHPRQPFHRRPRAYRLRLARQPLPLYRRRERADRVAVTTLPEPGGSWVGSRGQGWR